MSKTFDELLKKCGIDPEAAEEQTTVADLIEAMNLLTSIVLGGEDNG